MTAKFISLEGIEGVGKSTIAQSIHDFLNQHHIAHIMTREPGGTEIAESIRQLLLQHYQEPMESDTELLLMFASRAQHLATVIRPALQKGLWIVTDRFTDASYAYQGGGRRVPFERISLLENFVHPFEKPDITLLFTAPASLALERSRHRSHTPDRFESEAIEFFERVQNAYLVRAAQEPWRFHIIDTSQPITCVIQQVEKILSAFI